MRHMEDSLADFFGAKWWDAWQAIGTIAAVFAAVALASIDGFRLRRARKSSSESERRATASLVSAWVETTYERSSDRRNYIRRDVLHVANESNAPVFGVDIAVAIGEPLVRVGPLAAYQPLAVLPPRHRRNWDISLGLLAYGGGLQIPAEAVAEVSFTDANDLSWHRDFYGTLFESANMPRPRPLSEQEKVAQLGTPSNPFNPRLVAMEFFDLLQAEDGSPTVEAIQHLLAPDAAGWETFTDEDLAGLCEEVADFGLASHVWYPAPQVAYIRLVHEQDQAKFSSPGMRIQIEVKLMTLVYTSEHGWRVFSVGGGATSSDWIRFPPDGLSDDPREEAPPGSPSES